MRLDVALQQRSQLPQPLAPQMIQAIEILQLPNIDLKDRIELELAENEVLEVEDAGETAPEVAPAPAAAPAEEPRDEAADEGGVEGEGGGGEAELSETLDRI